VGNAAPPIVKITPAVTNKPVESRRAALSGAVLSEARIVFILFFDFYNAGRVPLGWFGLISHTGFSGAKKGQPNQENGDQKKDVLSWSVIGTPARFHSGISLFQG
jgi:hypothetical protein